MGDQYTGPDTLPQSQDDSSATYQHYEKISDSEYGYITPTNDGGPSNERVNYQSSSTREGLDVPSIPGQQQAAPDKPDPLAAGEKSVNYYVTHGEVSIMPVSNQTTGGNNELHHSQSKFSIGRKQCIIATVVIVCVVVVALCVGFYFMGAYLSSSAASEATTSLSVPEPATTATTTTTTTAASLNPPTTLDHTLPVECINATNFTRSWRMNTQSSDIRPGFGSHSINGYACDLHSDLGWFRFTGEAGDRILNRCPGYKSCGTYYSIWSDAEHPQQVGVASPIFVYLNSNINCRFYTRRALVMRCSDNTDYDYIYKYTGEKSDTCKSAFCGMRAD